MKKLSPHSGAFAAASSSSTIDYAGLPVFDQPCQKAKSLQSSNNESESKLKPLFSPTMQDPSHSESWGLKDTSPHEPGNSAAQADYASERLRKQREYWERELDIKMVFHFLKSRFLPSSASQWPDTPHQPVATKDDSTRRADVVRRHHPLVAGSQQPSIARLGGKSSLQPMKRSASTCATESAKSCCRPSIARSGSSSRNYWDIGGSIGSGSALASGGMMGAWGEI